MNITIIPKRVKMIRESQNIAMNVIAERSKISERQIARIECSPDESLTVHENTAMGLARALGTKIAVLKGEVPLVLENRISHSGKTKKKVNTHRKINYDLVHHHYGIEKKELIDLAPVLFTLMAEASIVWHRKRQRKFVTQFDDILNSIPFNRNTDIEEEYAPAVLKMIKAAEEINFANVSERNLCGNFHDGGDAPNSYASNGNPFQIYLYYFIEKIVKDGFKADMAVDESNSYISDSVVEWRGKIIGEKLDQFDWPSNDFSGSFIRILEDLYREIAGLNQNNVNLEYGYKSILKTTEGRDALLAHESLVEGYVRISEIPKELFGNRKTKERVKWLVGKLPEGYKEKMIAEWQRRDNDSPTLK